MWVPVAIVKCWPVSARERIIPYSCLGLGVSRVRLPGLGVQILLPGLRIVRIKVVLSQGLRLKKYAPPTLLYMISSFWDSTFTGHGGNLTSMAAVSVHSPISTEIIACCGSVSILAQIPRTPKHAVALLEHSVYLC